MDPLDIRLALQLAGLVATGTGVVFGVKYSIKTLTAGLNGHIKNETSHLTLKEREALVIVSTKTDKNEELITVLRDDLEKHETNVRQDLKDGLELIRQTIKNGH